MNASTFTVIIAALGVVALLAGFIVGALTGAS